MEQGPKLVLNRTPKRIFDIMQERSPAMEELAAFVNVTRATLYHWKKKGTIPADYVEAVAVFTALPRHEIRPDLWREDCNYPENEAVRTLTFVEQVAAD